MGSTKSSPRQKGRSRRQGGSLPLALSGTRTCLLQVSVVSVVVSVIVAVFYSLAMLVFRSLCSGSWDGEVRLWKLDSKLRSFELVGSIPTPGVVNSLQFVSPSKGSLDGVAWARPPSHDGNADVSSGGKAAAGPVLLVAGLGQETRLGRWIVVKENGARNGSSVFALHPRTS